MSIESPTGILDIRNATLKVSKLEVTNATGFDTALNNIARNTILLVDSTEQTASNSWALKLPNAWVGEFEGYWSSGASGNIDFNFYNNTTSGTNGYTLSMDDTTIVVKYDGATLQTTTLSSTLKTSAYRKVHILFERDTISVSIDGSRELYFKDSSLRSRVYDDEAGGYITVGGLDSTNRKFKNLKVVNEKWISDGTSNIAYMGGNLGVGVVSPAQTLEVAGTMRVSNVSDSSIVADMYAYQVTGSGWDAGVKLVASDAAAYDRFGGAVAISGDGNTAIVGAYFDDVTYTDQGSAYIFTYSGGTWDAGVKLVHPTPAASDQFSYDNAVAISGDGNTVIVGAPYDDDGGTNSGSAYVFTRSGGTWNAGVRLVASDGAANDWFGNSVAIAEDGNTALVGAPRDGNYTGSAYIFTHSGGTWNAGVKIVASDGAVFERFGYSVAISGDGNTAIAGAYGDDTGQGSAYIFTYSDGTWDAGVKLVHPQPADNDYFGRGVAISGNGNTVIVGAPQDDTNAGSAYIFTRSSGTWNAGVRLVASDGATQDYFGQSVAISSDGNIALVGAYNEDPGSVTNAGSAYIFTRSSGTWDTGVKIVASDPAANDWFGLNVAISLDGNTAIVGAHYDDDNITTDTGSAYIFKNSRAYNALQVSIPITADGTLLSFTGQHMCFPDGPMSQGLVVSANKNKYLNLNGPLTTGLGAIKSSESLPVVTLSNVTNDRSVFGVVDRLESGGTVRNQTTGITIVNSTKELGDNRVIVNSIGEGAMWVANTNGNLVSGDYITTSNIAGYGQKQDSDSLKNYTVAKITMDCDFNPEDLPVQVIKKDAGGKNVLDAYGRLQWEDTDRTQKAYSIRYLTTDGTRTDQANAVWTAAYVGCTYHCG
jgi:hypothetical protein